MQLIDKARTPLTASHHVDPIQHQYRLSASDVVAVGKAGATVVRQREERNPVDHTRRLDHSQWWLVAADVC